MSYLFISHASDDKESRVRPLVKALIEERLELWIDRPGCGPSHFGFSDRYIEANNILGIRAGVPYDEAIREALNESGAVLFCLSRAFSRQRAVLEHEVVIASNLEKLVACVVDDLPYSELPTTGLINPRIHYERINPERISEALAELEARRSDPSRGEASPDALPPPMQEAWEVVRRLKRNVTEVFTKTSENPLVRPTDSEWKAAKAQLAKIPVTPALRLNDVPKELEELLVDRFDKAALVRQLIRQAMRLRSEVNPEKGTDRQILIRMGELPPIETAPPAEFWAQALFQAGYKSPRTLAALIVAPCAPNFDTMSERAGGEIRAFLERLKRLETNPNGGSNED